MPTCLNFTGTPTQYVPASLRHDTNGWYIVYYEFNPIIDALERKRVRLNQLRKRCRTALEFKVQATDIMRIINNQIISSLQVMNHLEKHPTIEREPTFQANSTINIAAKEQAISEMSSLNANIRYYTPLVDLIDIYLKEKQEETREATFRSYKSSCLFFKRWIQERMPECKSIMFTKAMAVEFLDVLNARSDIGARTYNNNMKNVCALFTWAVKKCYVKENYFAGADLKRVQKKKRTVIPENARQLIDEWFKKNNPSMCIIMRMVYTSLLRPVEASRVQVEQLDFEQHCIHMPGDKTKNWEDRDARMDAELEALLREHIKGARPKDYLFSYGKWTCGTQPMNPNHFTKAWERMRASLLDAKGERIIPNEFQLYSLRDTSINGMLKAGVDDLSAMQAAGHKDLKMTAIYADHYDKDLFDNLNKQAPKF